MGRSKSVPKRLFLRTDFETGIGIKTFFVSKNGKKGNKIMTNQNKIQSTKTKKELVGLSSQKIFFNTCFDKNHLKTLIAWFLEQYGEKVTVDLVETLKQVGFHQATRAGVSLGLDDLKIPPQKNTLLSQASIKMNEVTNAIQTGNVTSVEKSQRLIDTWNQTSENLRQAAVQNFRTTNPVNPVYMMAFSGARGNISQVRQLVAMRGLMADPQGAILEFPIQSNFREGLTVTEYLLSCYGARKGLVDTALRTATSGYLTRRLVDAVQHVVVHVTDCHTKKGIVIRDKNLEQRLLGRVLFEDIYLNKTTIIKKNTLISQSLAKEIASKHKEILVRSPLTCQTEKSVCQLCYGLDLAQGKLVSIGEAVGILAAQSIGEPGTQLTMRTFHTGGVGVFSDQAMKSFSAPFAGKVEFLEPLSGLFVRTPHGNIVYLLKHKIHDLEKPLLKLTSSHPIYKPNVYQIMHGDVPAGSLLWVKQGESVKSGQLLLQASRLQTATQEMPESSHPVRTPFSGEVCFQSMAIEVREIQKNLQITKSSQQNKKEISPTFRTLLKLGNFWVFSTFVQKEKIFCNSFFQKGDLFSSETPIQQYILYLEKTGQLKKENSSIVFGRHYFEFLFSNIQYSGLFYFFQEQSQIFPKFGKDSVTKIKKVSQTNLEPILQKEKNKVNLFVYTSNSKYTLLTWYPFFKTVFHSQNVVKLGTSAGYCSVLSFDQDLLTTKNLDFVELSKGVVKSKQNVATYSHASYIWSLHQLFRLKTNQNKIKFLDNAKNPLQSSCFVVSQTATNFSKIGICQFEADTTINWNLKTHFDKEKFLLNFHENESKTPVKTPFNTGEFVKKGLALSHKKLFQQKNPKLIQKKQVWVYIPETLLLESISSQLSGMLLKPGKFFETICFDHSYVSLNLLENKNIVFIKSKTNQSFCYSSLPKMLDPKFDCNNFKISPIGQVKKFARQKSKTFCFYKHQGVFESKTLVFKTKKKRRLSHVLVIQKTYQQLFLNTKFFKQNTFLQKKVPSLISVKSPLFTKQFKTTGYKNGIFGKESQRNLKPSFKIISPMSSDWLSLSSFLKIEIKFNTSKSFQKTEQLKQNIVLTKNTNFGSNCKNNKSLLFSNFWNLVQDQSKFQEFWQARGFLNESQTLVSPGFSVFFYQKIKLKNSNQFEFLSFQNGWILPEWEITKAFLTAKKLGEFRGAQNKLKQKSITLSLLQTQDRCKVKLPLTQLIPNLDNLGQDGEQAQKNLSLIEVGTKVRWGQEHFQGFAFPVSGQIIKTTLKTMTLRKGLPLLASIRGLVHVSHKDFVEKNELLITLRSKRLQTEDIVQGIPKIEQLFEARETQGGEIIENNMHKLLNEFFSRARQLRPVDEAVQLSLLYIQKFLVEKILEAYSNQGVTIAEKHVEVVVRQMTARVRITHSGDTGFIPGELVQLRTIEKMNLLFERQGRRKVLYEPLILGITKSVLQSESFLVAASFQQVSKVLVRSALAKKTDFLRGLHEHILVGQPIPAGTGIFTLTESIEKIPDSLDTSETSL